MALHSTIFLFFLLLNGREPVTVLPHVADKLETVIYRAGMWIVGLLDFYPFGSLTTEIIHLINIVYSAHLLDVSDDFVPADVNY